MNTMLTFERMRLGLAPLALLLLAGCGNTEAKLPTKAEEAPSLSSFPSRTPRRGACRPPWM